MPGSSPCLRGLRAALAATMLLPAAHLIAASLPYPVQGDFQWVSNGPDVPAVDWNSPTISDNGVYVVAASDTFSGVSLRFNRTAPSLTYQMVGAPCGQTFCAAFRPRVSGDGRHVVFESRWRYPDFDLGSHVYVYVWDSQTGVTRLASANPDGSFPGANSLIGDISRDGRYVSFLSASALGIDASPGNKVFLADMASSPPAIMGITSPFTYSPAAETARISGDGRFVVFRAGERLHVRDRQAGQPTQLGWLGSGSNMADGEHSLALSPDGRFAVQSLFTGSVSGFSAYQFDRIGGYIAPYLYADNLGSVAVSSGGGFIVAASCSFTGANYFASVGIRAPRTGSSAAQGIADGALETCDFGIDITPKGDLIAVSLPDLVDPDFGPQSSQQVFVVKNPLYQPLPANIAQYAGGIPANSTNVKSSADGKLVVFQSEIPAEQLLCFDAESQVYVPGCVPSDTNGQDDIFRYDFDRNAIDLVSSADGLTAAGGRNPDIDLNGEAIVFEAGDGALAAKSLRDGRDYGVRTGKASLTSVYLSRLIRGASQRSTQRLSVSRTGGNPNGNSQNPSISANGRYVSFSTDANNINPGSDANAVRDVVRIEPDSGTVVCVSSCAGAVANQASDRPSVSNSGTIALESRADTLVKEYRGKGSSPYTQIVLVDPAPARRSTRTVSRAGSGQPGFGNSLRPRISSSGNAVVYQSDAPLTPDDSNNRTDVVLANLISGANQRISRRPPPGRKANPHAPRADAKTEDGDSVSPTISGDGRYIAFQTTATNLVDVDANGVTDLVVADVRNGQLRRVYQGFGGVETDGASETPHLNQNGTQLGFHSFATNLNELGDTDPSTSEPYVRTNPQAASVVFFDPFE